MPKIVIDVSELPNVCDECNLCYDDEVCMSHGCSDITLIGYRPTECPLIEEEGSTNARIR